MSLQYAVTVAILSVYNVVCVLAVDVFYVLFSFTRSSSNVRMEQECFGEIEGEA